MQDAKTFLERLGITKLKEWKSGSASQENTFSECQMLWWWERRAGKRSGSTKQMQRGSCIHWILEHYLEHAEMPKVSNVMAQIESEFPMCKEYGKPRNVANELITVASSGSHFLPQPPISPNQIERGFVIQTSDMPVPWVGFIDLLRVSPTGVTDHKGRASIRYSKTMAELATDPQKRLYGAVAQAVLDADPADDENLWGRSVTRIHAPKFVAYQFEHINYGIKEKRATSVKLQVSAERAAKDWQTTVDHANEMYEISLISDPRLVKPSPTPNGCFSYGRRCPHYSMCAACGHVEQDEMGVIMGFPWENMKLGNGGGSKKVVKSEPVVKSEYVLTPAHRAVLSLLHTGVADQPEETIDLLVEHGYWDAAGWAVTEKGREFVVDAHKGINPPDGVGAEEKAKPKEYNAKYASAGPYLPNGDRLSKVRKAELISVTEELYGTLNEAQKGVYGAVCAHFGAAQKSWLNNAAVAVLRQDATWMLQVLAMNDEQLQRQFGVQPLDALTTTIGLNDVNDEPEPSVAEYAKMVSENAEVQLELDVPDEAYNETTPPPVAFCFVDCRPDFPVVHLDTMLDPLVRNYCDTKGIDHIADLAFNEGYKAVARLLRGARAAGRFDFPQYLICDGYSPYLPHVGDVLRLEYQMVG